MRHTGAILLFAALGGLAGAARAQDEGDGKSFQITANFQVQAPVSGDTSTEDMTKVVFKLQESLGEVAGKQCDVLAAAFHGTCAVVQLNMNSNIEGRRRFNNPEFANGARRVFAGVNATFAVAPASKPAPTPAKP